MSRCPLFFNVLSSVEISVCVRLRVLKEMPQYNYYFNFYNFWRVLNGFSLNVFLHVSYNYTSGYIFSQFNTSPVRMTISTLLGCSLTLLVLVPFDL